MRSWEKGRLSLLLTLVTLAGLLVPGGAEDGLDVQAINFVSTRAVDLDGGVHKLGLDGEPQAVIVLFLDPGCPISNRYAPELQEFHREAKARDMKLYGVFSDPSITNEEVQAYRSEREIDFPLLLDRHGELASRLKPSHIPEVFLIDKEDRLLYRGRIDNRFVSIGRMRQQITSHDLLDAMEAVSRGQEPKQARTEPIGCVFETFGEELPEEVTYTQHVAPILKAHCLECHTRGGGAPFTLESYEKVARRASMIGYVTKERIMPPWTADRDYRRFQNDRGLSSREIEILQRWVKTGKARGPEEAELPVSKTSSLWQLGPPDAEVKMVEPYSLPARGKDQYRRFVLPYPFRKDVELVAIDFRPGDPEVVHHVNIFYDTTGRARERDRLDPEPGYDAFGKAGLRDDNLEWNEEGRGLGGWAPGSGPYRLPKGVGIALPPGGDLVIEVHYHLSGKASSDQSTLALYLADKPVSRYAEGFLAGAQDIYIPAGEPGHRRSISFELPRSMELVSLFPHMHYIGTRVEMEAQTPSGQRIPLLKIGDWDFRWQGFYQYRRPLFLPKGSRITARFEYDNSAQNPDNPHHPPQDIKWGWQSTDEMLEVWGTFVETSPADTRAIQWAALQTFYRSSEK